MHGLIVVITSKTCRSAPSPDGIRFAHPQALQEAGCGGFQRHPAWIVVPSPSVQSHGPGAEVVVSPYGTFNVSELFPRRSPKQPLPGIGLHDPLHGRQACPEFVAFDQGVDQICPRYGLFSCRFLPKRGQICYIPVPPNG